MKTEKRLKFSVALLIATMIFLTINISAQQRQGQGPPQVPSDAELTQMMEDMTSQLSLTDNQSGEIKELFADHFSDMKSSMSSGQRPSRDAMESQKTEFEDNVKNLLNDEQQDLFDEFMEKQKKQPQSNQRSRR